MCLGGIVRRVGGGKHLTGGRECMCGREASPDEASGEALGRVGWAYERACDTASPVSFAIGRGVRIQSRGCEVVRDALGRELPGRARPSEPPDLDERTNHEVCVACVVYETRPHEVIDSGGRHFARVAVVEESSEQRVLASLAVPDQSQRSGACFGGLELPRLAVELIDVDVVPGCDTKVPQHSGGGGAPEVTIEVDVATT